MKTTTITLQRSGICIIDLETGGLDEQSMGIIEIGACWLHTEETFFRECRPFAGSRIEIEAMRVNGYDEQRARDPKRMSDTQAVVELFGWVRGGMVNRDARVQMAGWNGHFDHRHIRASAKRAGVGEDFFPIRHSILDPQAILTAAIVRGEIRVEGLDPAHLQAHPELWGGLVKGADHASEILGLTPEQKPHNALRGALQVKAMLQRLLRQPVWQGDMPMEAVAMESPRDAEMERKLTRAKVEEEVWQIIATERKRQIDMELYSAQHDDEHPAGMLAKAAEAYETWADRRTSPLTAMPLCWPWEAQAWKPKNIKDAYFKAGALYLAEADRAKRSSNDVYAAEMTVSAQVVVTKVTDYFVS